MPIILTIAIYLLKRTHACPYRQIAEVAGDLLAHVVITNFKVQVRTGGHTRVAHVSNYLPLADLFTHGGIEFAHMGIKGLISVAVIDYDAVAVGAVIRSFRHNAGIGSVDGRTCTVSNIHGTAS